MSQPENIGEAIARWRERQEEWLRFHVQVDGAALAGEVISDLESVAATNDNDSLSLTQAALESGYSAGHLGREVKAGRIPNAGRENAPRIRRRDLPRKPGFLPSGSTDSMISRKRIARSVVNSQSRRDDEEKSA